MGYGVPHTSRFIVTVVLALSAGLSTHFLGGSAAASGHIPLPLAREHPIRFAATGGVAVLVMVLALGYVFYVRGEERLAPAESLFEVLENERYPKNRRIQAFRDLRGQSDWPVPFHRATPRSTRTALPVKPADSLGADDQDARPAVRRRGAAACRGNTPRSRRRPGRSAFSRRRRRPRSTAKAAPKPGPADGRLPPRPPRSGARAGRRP